MILCPRGPRALFSVPQSRHTAHYSMPLPREHPGVLVLKYDTLGAKHTAKVPTLAVGSKSAKVGHPARQTAKVDILAGIISQLIGYPGISWDIVGYRLFSHKGLHSAPWAEARAKLLKLALPSWGGGEQNC